MLFCDTESLMFVFFFFFLVKIDPKLANFTADWLMCTIKVNRVKFDFTQKYRVQNSAVVLNISMTCGT